MSKSVAEWARIWITAVGVYWAIVLKKNKTYGCDWQYCTWSCVLSYRHVYYTNSLWHWPPRRACVRPRASKPPTSNLGCCHVGDLPSSESTSTYPYQTYQITIQLGLYPSTAPWLVHSYSHWVSLSWPRHFIHASGNSLLDNVIYRTYHHACFFLADIQHFRIINKKSSEGFSPWFLLLGSTSSASGMLNMYVEFQIYPLYAFQIVIFPIRITMQWGIMKCCRVLVCNSFIALQNSTDQCLTRGWVAV